MLLITTLFLFCHCSFKVPLVTKFLVGLCLTMFLVQQSMFDSGISDTYLLFGLSPERIVNDLEWYRVFTTFFLHSNIFHLFRNTMGLLSFGCQIEQQIGSLRYFEAMLWAMVLTKSIYVIIVSTFSAVGADSIRTDQDFETYMGSYVNNILRFGKSTVYPAEGFSGVIFYLCVFECVIFPNLRRKIFSQEIPNSWYPWVVWVMTDCFSPYNSFYGHLSGIIASLLILTSAITPFLVHSETLQKLEDSPLATIIRGDSYFVKTPLRDIPNRRYPTRNKITKKAAGLFHFAVLLYTATRILPFESWSWTIKALLFFFFDALVAGFFKATGISDGNLMFMAIFQNASHIVKQVTRRRRSI